MSITLSLQDEVTLKRYLTRYAETSVHALDGKQFKAFDSIIVVPIYDEPEENLLRLLAFQDGFKGNRSTLMIWVFNAPQSTLESPSLIRTQQVFKRLLLHTKAQHLTDNLYRAQPLNCLQLLLVDRCHDHLIPDKQGVGLARKLGMDMALSLIYQQYIQTQYWCPWIYSTDADVSLPENYALIPPKENTTACIYPFVHLPEAGYEEAMKAYEFSLHYYVQSLKYAGSPYAFHTIGSLIVVSSMAYAKVRGMPKRAGAEDFYLLNKLAKLGRIESLSAPLIKVSGRPSHRVPFGTGPAVVKIQADYDNASAFHVYHPRNFLLLAYVIKSVAEIEHSSAIEDVLLSRLASKLSDPKERSCVLEILNNLGWKKQALHLKQVKSTEAMQTAFHVWFDGFITLRFIHECRDRLYPNILLTDLPEQLAGIDNGKFLRGSDLDYTAWFKTLGI